MLMCDSEALLLAADRVNISALASKSKCLLRKSTPCIKKAT
jgi:hypothetical protein